MPSVSPSLRSMPAVSPSLTLPRHSTLTPCSKLLPAPPSPRLPQQEKGLFSQKAVTRSPQEAMATDPSVMVDMMKKNLTGMVPQVRGGTGGGGGGGGGGCEYQPKLNQTIKGGGGGGGA